MLLLQDFPYELITLIISNLNGKDILQFIQCNSSIYDRSQEDSFWWDLCKLNRITYRHPDMSWKDLFCSGELSKMCHHLLQSMSSISTIQQKKQLLWKSLMNQENPVNNDHILCLNPCCDFFGDDTCYKDHYASVDNKHNIILKVSPRHTLEVWCNACAKPIGFDGFASSVSQVVKAEKFIMTKLLRALTTITDPTDNDLAVHITKGRQEIESAMYKNQFIRQSTMHVVEKGWHTAWVDFISGKSRNFPGALTNTRLFQSDGSLDPTLSLGKDFELIGNLTRWYIERIYGVAGGTIICSNDLHHIPEYCKLVHSIRLRQQMNQAAARYPPIFAASN